MKTSKAHRVSCILLAAAMALCLISGIGAHAVMTDGGAVEVKDVRIETDNGILSMLIYKPKAATPEHPLPAVIASHGAFNSREMQDINLVELSRRGMVVISIDMYSHGHSDVADVVRYIRNDAGQYLSLTDGVGAFVDAREEAARFAANGMIETVEYVWNELSYVDRDKIGVTGHSVGAKNTLNTLQYYSYQKKYGDGVSKVSAGLLAAGRSNLNVADFDEANVGFMVGDYDEFAIYGMGDQTGPDYMRSQGAAFMSAQTGDASLLETGYEPGTLMYNEDGLLRVWYVLPMDHPLLHFSNQGAASAVEFFETSWNLDSGVARNDFVWSAKVFFNALGLVGFFLFLLPAISLLLESSFFSGLKLRRKEGEALAAAIPAQEKPAGKGQYLLYFGIMLLLTVLPALTYFKFMDLGAAIPLSNAFPMSVGWQISVWASLNGLLALLVIFAVYFAYSRRKGTTLEQMGLRISGGSAVKTLRLVLKTVLLAFTAIVGCYLLLCFCDYFFKTDFRIYTLGVKTFTPDKIFVFLSYLGFFLVWSFANNLAVNGNFRKGMGEKLPMVLSILSNVLGITVILMLYYGSYIGTGRPMFLQSMYPILLYNFVPLLILAAVFSRLLYKKTGNVYLGTVVNASLLCLLTITNTGMFFI